MKKAWILAISTVCLVLVSTLFYYNQIDFSNGLGDLPYETNISQIKNDKENKKWVNRNKEDAVEEEIEIKNATQDDTSKKDLSICNENGKIMVLMYHKFAEKSDDGWTRTLSDFKKDLELLYEKNYYPINMSDYINGKIDVPYGKTPVILTFDDGTAGQLSFEWVGEELRIKENTAVKVYQDFVKAHPDFPMRGTFYIMSTNFFGAKGTLSQRLEYLINQGFEIGNQTQNHYALQKADSADKVIQEVGGLAKFVGELVPGYVINSFSIPGGTMTKQYAEQVYAGEYEGFKYENKGIVLLYGSKPTLSPIDSELDLKKISRIRVSGNEKLDNDLEDWVNYFDAHPDEKFISDGDVNTFVINSSDEEKVINSDKIVIK